MVNNSVSKSAEIYKTEYLSVSYWVVKSPLLSTEKNPSLALLLIKTRELSKESQEGSKSENTITIVVPHPEQLNGVIS